jgi:RNA polymerase sigma-70 factor, ECF subfamily
MNEDRVAALLADVAQGNHASFRMLYHLTCDAMFGVLMRILRNRASAEDGLQEVYIRIWQRATTFNIRKGNGMTWMIAIARNFAIDQKRQHKRVGAEDIDLDQLVDPHRGPDEQVSARSIAARIVFCLGQLEPRHADCIKSAYLDGASYADIAEQHVVPINTVRTWLRRGLQKLRTCVTD